MTKKLGQVDIFINNAGAYFRDQSDKAEAFRVQFQTNYANTRALNEKILEHDLVKANGKIIFVSSGLGRFGRVAEINPEVYKKLEAYKTLTFDDLATLQAQCVDAHEKGVDRAKWAKTIYNSTKLLLNIFVNILSRDEARIISKGIQVYIMHPGWCRTDMTKSYGDAPPKSAIEGGQTAIYLSDLPFEINEALQGEYFADSKHGSLI